MIVLNDLGSVYDKERGGYKLTYLPNKFILKMINRCSCNAICKQKSI